MFILYFIIAAAYHNCMYDYGVSADVFAPLKELSKFFIIMAMAAIGLNSNVVKLIKSAENHLCSVDAVGSELPSRVWECSISWESGNYFIQTDALVISL